MVLDPQLSLGPPQNRRGPPRAGLIRPTNRAAAARDKELTDPSSKPPGRDRHSRGLPHAGRSRAPQGGGGPIAKFARARNRCSAGTIRRPLIRAGTVRSWPLQLAPAKRCRFPLPKGARPPGGPCGRAVAGQALWVGARSTIYADGESGGPRAMKPDWGAARPCGDHPATRLGPGRVGRQETAVLPPCCEAGSEKKFVATGPVPGAGLPNRDRAGNGPTVVEARQPAFGVGVPARLPGKLEDENCRRQSAGGFAKAPGGRPFVLSTIHSAKRLGMGTAGVFVGSVWRKECFPHANN